MPYKNPEDRKAYCEANKEKIVSNKKLTVKEIKKR